MRYLNIVQPVLINILFGSFWALSNPIQAQEHPDSLLLQIKNSHLLAKNYLQVDQPIQLAAQTLYEQVSDIRQEYQKLVALGLLEDDS